MKAFRIITVVLVLSIMVFIFCMSAQDASESTDTSSAVIIFLAKLFVKGFREMTATQQFEIIASLQFFVRKAAHFSVYALLGACSYLSVVTYKKIPFWFRSGIGAVFCLCYAISDEIHQTFVPGRSGEFRDVCIDFCGVLLAITVLTLIAKFSKSKLIRNSVG